MGFPHLPTAQAHHLPLFLPVFLPDVPLSCPWPQGVRPWLPIILFALKTFDATSLQNTGLARRTTLCANHISSKRCQGPHFLSSVRP